MKQANIKVWDGSKWLSVILSNPSNPNGSSGSSGDSTLNIINGLGSGSIQQKDFIIVDDQDVINKHGGEALGPNTVALNKDTIAYQIASSAFGGGSQAGMSEEDFVRAFTTTIMQSFDYSNNKHVHVPLIYKDDTDKVYKFNKFNAVPGVPLMYTVEYVSIEDPNVILNLSIGAVQVATCPVKIVDHTYVEAGPLNITHLEKVYDTHQYLNYNTAWSFAFAAGEVNKSLGRASFTANFSNEAWAKFSSAFGDNNYISPKAIAGFVSGQACQLNASYTFAANMGNIVDSVCGSAFGYNNTVNADANSAFVAGKENYAVVSNEMAIGEFNRYKDSQNEWDVAQDGDRGEGWSTKIYDRTGENKQQIANLQLISGGDDEGDTAADTIFSVGTGVSNTMRHTAFRIKKDSTIEHRVKFGYSNGGNLIRKKVFKTDTTGHIKIYEAPTENLHPVRYKELLALKSTTESALASLEDRIQSRLSTEIQGIGSYLYELDRRLTSGGL